MQQKWHALCCRFQDLFTKWIEICPLRQATGPKIKDAFEDLIICRWGTPRVLLSDNGTEFINKTLRHLTDDLGICHTTTPPYHPQANPVERVNRVLKAMIISFLDQDHRQWDLHLKEFRLAYNTAVHSATKASPAFLNTGREFRIAKSMKMELERNLPIEKRDVNKW